MTTGIPDFSTPAFNPDNLGGDYSQHVIELGEDPDGEGLVRAVLVRYRPVSSKSDFSARPAAMWIHGMSDYFFQTHVAEQYHANGYAFYAIDLRKCGRAHLAGQTWHGCSNLNYYFEDLDRALEVLSRAGHKTVSINAHSTGGLIAALWLDRLHSAGNRGPQAAGIAVTSVVLNSPWLALHVCRLRVLIYSLAAAIMSKLQPTELIPAQSAGGYGKSISNHYEGRWKYDLSFKPILGHDKSWQWLNAIIGGQRKISRGIDIGVPALVLHSDGFRLDSDYTPALRHVDAVLNTDLIAKQARRLGARVRDCPIPGALHDVYLSEPEALQRAFDETFSFLRNHTRAT